MVWAICLVTYQALLLAGYLYATIICRLHHSFRWIHPTAFTVTAILLLTHWILSGDPLLSSLNSTHLATGHPIWVIVRYLLCSIGLPFLLLSSTTTVLQFWLVESGRPNPYVYFATSNAGSIFGLLAYPMLLEPLMGSAGHSAFWTFCFVVFVLGIWLAFLLLQRSRPSSLGQDGVPEPEPPSQIPTWSCWGRWIVLAAIPSFALVASTVQITTNVAPVPLLWIIPLLLYLLSFILVFGLHGAFSVDVLSIAVLAATGGAWYAIDKALTLPLLMQAGLHLSCLFLVSSLCHLVLYRHRPCPRRLPQFYLALSLGGVLGGLLSAIVCPLVLSGYWEYHLFIFGSAVLATRFLFQSPNSSMKGWRIPSVAVTASLAFLLAGNISEQRENAVLLARSFFGAVRVQSKELPMGQSIHALMHGQICHGFQFQTGPEMRTPTAYFHEDTGVGIALRNHPRSEQGLRIGVMGTGIATLAAYGRDVDTIRFYEIDRQVIEIAKNRELFSYLSDSPATCSVVLGDARLALERDLAEVDGPLFDILVMDVFSGDALPTHFLTVEAMNLYKRALAPRGVLAFQLTNAFIDLVPILWAAKDAAGMSGVVIESPGDGYRRYKATWAILSLDPSVLTTPEFLASGSEVNVEPITPWTDHRSEILSHLIKALMRKPTPHESSPEEHLRVD